MWRGKGALIIIRVGREGGGDSQLLEFSYCVKDITVHVSLIYASRPPLSPHAPPQLLTKTTEIK
jgi:hypothetical protein